MNAGVKLYAWIVGCFIGFGLPPTVGPGTLSDSLYILGLACLIGAIAQYKSMGKTK